MGPRIDIGRRAVAFVTVVSFALSPAAPLAAGPSQAPAASPAVGPPAPKPTAAEKGMTWRQVMDGKGWKAEIGKLYGIGSIPAAFLVDGDTGEVLASGGMLRGDQLEKTLSKALAKKKGAQ